MADTNQKSLLKSLIGEDAEDNLLDLYLQLAERKVLDRLYPYDDTKTVVPSKYSLKVVEIAQYLYFRRGSEGQINHSENGISRSYESADVPASMLADILPMVGGIKCEH